MLRFKLEENLRARAADLLRQAGHDAMTVLQQQRGGQPDPPIARVGQSEKPALITVI